MKRIKDLIDYFWVVTCKFLAPYDKQGAAKTHVKRKLRNRVREYYRHNQPKDTFVAEALEYLRSYGYHTAICFPFREQYSANAIKIDYDFSGQPFSVLTNGKKIFMPRVSKEEASRMLCEIMIEQDKLSPHRYEDSDFGVEQGDVVVDVGCSEGYFALSVIEKAKKVYLFECEQRWMEPLAKTFEPWKDKVEIIQKYVSDETTDSSVTMEDFFADKADKPTFIKLDIEGAETAVLRSLTSLWHTANLRMAVCTYHLKTDYDQVRTILEEHGMKHTESQRRILMSLDGYEPPYFRTALLRASIDIAKSSVR